jgi:ubiquinol-cytochrome c reductase cytochrome c1 subunit
MNGNVPRPGAKRRNPMAALVATMAVAAVAIVATLLPAPAHAAAEGVALDHFPTSKLTDQVSLQDGARTFVNYCQGCHGAALMRYNRLRDIGLSEDLIRDNLLFAGQKVGDPMKIAMRPEDAKTWFGALPPDLSVIARARSSGAGSGSDWLYTYLRSYYRDNTRATGWNNVVFPNVGMPHVFWGLQGSRGATIEEVKAEKDEGGKVTGFSRTLVTYDPTGARSEKKDKLEQGHLHEYTKTTLGPAQGGSLTQAQYDETVANLVAFLTYVSDPTAKTRTRLGVWVLLFLTVLVFMAWWLNREYWKDVK